MGAWTDRRLDGQTLALNIAQICFVRLGIVGVVLKPAQPLDNLNICCGVMMPASGSTEGEASKAPQTVEDVASQQAGQDDAAGALAIVRTSTSKASYKSMIKEFRALPAEEVLDAAKTGLENKRKETEAAEAAHKAKEEEVADLLNEFKGVQTRVAEAVEEEGRTARAWAEAKKRKVHHDRELVAKQTEYFNAQKHFAVVQVQKKIQDLEAQRAKSLDEAAALQKTKLEIFQNTSTSSNIVNFVTQPSDPPVSPVMSVVRSDASSSSSASGTPTLQLGGAAEYAESAEQSERDSS